MKRRVFLRGINGKDDLYLHFQKGKKAADLLIENTKLLSPLSRLMRVLFCLLPIQIIHQSISLI